MLEIAVPVAGAQISTSARGRLSGRGMVKAEDVRAAYRLFLDREPENPEIVAGHVKTAGSLRDLCDRFLNSAEFRGSHSLPQFMPLAAPALDVEIDASPAQSAAMVRHIEASWRRFGLSEPHFSVIVSDAFRAERIAETEGEFYQTGSGFIEELRRTAERCGIDLGGFRRCFELGAGVGRISVWLAGQFDMLCYSSHEMGDMTSAGRGCDIETEFHQLIMHEIYQAYSEVSTKDIDSFCCMNLSAMDFK